ncbi:flagellar assembly protein FliH [Shewanella sp. D64]|uniref:flagellar assembly protein FliH n=1 Tax=unclassified Shewanella TaxID=196818 RepID=UPI0022BA3EF2|nr:MULTISPECIES: flagellar assembly protein FliH [unclassified Shewanella]MEC4726509.1 flagellar assembly protein FliH [Shewanella sp. D64]MEC4737450.1 flagellar assembly protein FliH [Shewanella sp. E94]WBJ97264.1 flagellar assembly protein FliH [Shewanella sp. MTB7]
MKPNKPEDATDIEVNESKHEFTHWHIPDVTEAIPEDISNLFGRREAQKPLTDEAVSILPPTLSQIEEIRQEAENEGFTQGKEEGHQAGLEAGRLEGLEQGHGEGFEQGKEQGYQEGLEKALEMLKRFEGLIEQFEKPLELLDNEIEQELVSLTLKLSRAVIGHEIKTHPEHILAALRQGVDSLPLKEQGVVIRLHPDDHQLTQELYTANQLEKNRWQLEVDPSLSPGDCIILSQRSNIDMRLESRMSAVLQELEGHHQHLGQIVEQQKQALDTSSMVNQGESIAESSSDPELNVADTISETDRDTSNDEPVNQADASATPISGDDSGDKPQ